MQNLWGQTRCIMGDMEIDEYDIMHPLQEPAEKFQISFKLPQAQSFEIAEKNRVLSRQNVWPAA